MFLSEQIGRDEATHCEAKLASLIPSIIPLFFYDPIRMQRRERNTRFSRASKEIRRIRSVIKKYNAETNEKSRGGFYSEKTRGARRLACYIRSTSSSRGSFSGKSTFIYIEATLFRSEAERATLL